MENNKLPYISVIIRAYNRKEFLLNAIKSVLNQTLDKKYYEIIIIKNFENKNIDDFINENKIKHVLTEGTMSEFLYKGISEANGEIISFLDDDDLFLENKLDIIYREFKKNDNIVYYHNQYIPINRNGKTLNVNNVNISPFVNMSSISIKKSIIKINKTVKINAADDTLIYLYALESNKKLIKGKKRLTYTLLHNSTTNIVCNNFEEYRKFIITLSDLDLNSYILFNNLFHSKRAINFLKSRTTSTQVYKYIFGSNEIPTQITNYIINSPTSLKYRVAFFLLYILIKVYPKSRMYISNKMWNMYKKSFNDVI